MLKPSTIGRRRRRGGTGPGRDILFVLPECVAMLVMLALIWAGIGNALLNARRNATDAAGRDTRNLAQAFSENTERIVAGADRALLSLRAAYVREGASFDLRGWAQSQLPPDRFAAHQLGVVARDGTVLASTASTRPVNIADRPHFIAQRDSGTRDELTISRPVLGRASNRWSFQLSRKIPDAHGGFDGVVVLSVDCYDLSRFYQTLDLQGGFISLVGTDGVLRARGPLLPDVIGHEVALPAGLLGSELRHATLPMPREGAQPAGIVSIQRVESYPLLVMIGFADAHVFARSAAMREQLLGWGVGSTLLILLIGAVWVRQRRRSLLSRVALQLTLENMSEGIVLVDAHGRVAVANRRAIELLRLPGAEAPGIEEWPRRPGGRPGGQHQAPGAWDGAVRDALSLYAPSARGGTSTVVHPDGLVIEGSRKLLDDGGVLQTISDVTDRRRAEDRIRQLAHYDQLTGLGSRALLVERLDAALAGWARAGTGFGVLCVDLNGFKQVNDTLGHDVGDAVLRAVADRLRALVGGEGFVARMGGDEFLVMLPGLEHEATARRIATALGAPLPAGSSQVTVGASIGIALCPEHGTDRAELLKNADIALYCAKGDRQRPVRTFDPVMAMRLHKRASIEHDLRLALEGGAFSLVFQPQLRVASLEVAGLEALVRWRHPTRGIVRPDGFIPIAEETGLIVPLGRQILERACLAAVTWPGNVRVAVNISPVQFRDAGLPELVAGALERSGLAPGRLELEVTEGVLIADEQQALRTLHALQALGVQVALDDFGTGYSSMRYLQRFPFNRIKLDRSFVQAQVSEERARAIMDSILMLGRRLDLGVVAEGVETHEQLALLRRQRCPEVQGFLTGRPLPEEAVIECLRHPPDLSVGAPQRPAALEVS